MLAMTSHEPRERDARKQRHGCDDLPVRPKRKTSNLARHPWPSPHRAPRVQAALRLPTRRPPRMQSPPRHLSAYLYMLAGLEPQTSGGCGGSPSRLVGAVTCDFAGLVWGLVTVRGGEFATHPVPTLLAISVSARVEGCAVAPPEEGVQQARHPLPPGAGQRAVALRVLPGPGLRSGVAERLDLAAARPRLPGGSAARAYPARFPCLCGSPCSPSSARSR